MCAEMKDILAGQVRLVYGEKANRFFEKVKSLNLTDAELSAVPSLFVPGWGEGYDSSCFKVAIAGKETYGWANEYGDSLKCDLSAYDKGQYDVLASCRCFRADGPSKWCSIFWQYPATALAKLFDSTRDSVLSKDNPLLHSIAWFNGHAVETYDSNGVKRSGITAEKMIEIQDAADEVGMSDFETFVKVFRPHVIFYFYRNKSGVPTRNFPSDIEFVKHWGDGIIDEYRMNGKTILLHSPHTTYFAHGNLKQDELADLVHRILMARNVRFAICEKDSSNDFYRMSAKEWVSWVDFVRDEAQKHSDLNNMSLSRHLIAVVAKELSKCNARMNAQTLVLILNEVDKFRQTNWQYSPNRRGPCSSVRGAWNECTAAGQKLEAGWIARAFTKIDGTYAYE